MGHERHGRARRNLGAWGAWGASGALGAGGSPMRGSGNPMGASAPPRGAMVKRGSGSRGAGTLGMTYPIWLYASAGTASISAAISAALETCMVSVPS